MSSLLLNIFGVLFCLVIVVCGLYYVFKEYEFNMGDEDE